MAPVDKFVWMKTKLFSTLNDSWMHHTCTCCTFDFTFLSLPHETHASTSSHWIGGSSLRKATISGESSGKSGMWHSFWFSWDRIPSSIIFLKMNDALYSFVSSYDRLKPSSFDIQILTIYIDYFGILVVRHSKRKCNIHIGCIRVVQRI